MIQLLATDIDGTLLDEHRFLSAQTLKAFQKVNYLPLILISARMPQAMYYLQDALQKKEMPIICYNGALVLNQQKQLHSTTIPFKDIEAIAQIALENNLHCSIYRGAEWFVPELDYWAQREENNTRVTPQVQALETTLAYFKETQQQGGAHKIMLMGDRDAMDHAFAKAGKLQSQLHLYRSKDTYTEISPMDISKKTALELLIKECFPEVQMQHVAAFGDNYNDVEMIAGVGHGVAVDNARDEVKAVAAYQTAHHKEHGVAQWIEMYL
ncbi:MAG: HAD family hydrolase [Nonlabens sp.]|uniref:HAD family hydrolase n=1 Tax=Nonlabens sp. TaxID=1888209 RepID=UPI003EF9F065